MVVWWKLVGLSWMLCAVFANAQAAEFSVGRADVVFPTDDWNAIELPDEGAAYSGDIRGVIASGSKLFVKQTPQRGIEAVALVRASNGGVSDGYMTYTRKCESTEDYYAEGTSGGAMRLFHCLQVHPLYNMAGLLNALGEPWTSALQPHQAQLPQAMYAVTSEYANSVGAFLNVVVLLAPGFEGEPGKMEEALPKDVKAGHVVWGQALGRAVRSSVNSISGTMKFPPLAFSR